jgi:hypothetical protein
LQDRAGLTPLHIAALFDHREICRYPCLCFHRGRAEN